ncbi:MAG: hypothetical protein R3E39_10960 [Anaerolineae bacterium]
MFYFDINNPAKEPAFTDIKLVTNRFMDLHSALLPRVRNHNLDLHPRWQKTSIVSQKSVASLDPSDSVVLTYFRSQEQAEKVERRMGKETVGINQDVDTYCHPVIEMRLTPEHFVIELVLSPRAWWDQRNLIGKLELPQHRTAFRNLLRGVDRDYRLGFWGGTHLSDMHLTVNHLLYGRVLDEWMTTFSDGQDWLRIGKWYSHDDPELDESRIQTESFNALKALHPIYNFILWTSNNNFHPFYDKRHKTTTRIHA